MGNTASTEKKRRLRGLKLFLAEQCLAADEAKKRALKIIFDSIASVIVKNQHVQLEAKHRDVFRFYTLDELKNLELDNYA